MPVRKMTEEDILKHQAIMYSTESSNELLLCLIREFEKQPPKTEFAFRLESTIKVIMEMLTAASFISKDLLLELADVLSRLYIHEPSSDFSEKFQEMGDADSDFTQEPPMDFKIDDVAAFTMKLKEPKDN